MGHQVNLLTRMFESAKQHLLPIDIDIEEASTSKVIGSLTHLDRQKSSNSTQASGSPKTRTTLDIEGSDLQTMTETDRIFINTLEEVGDAEDDASSVSSFPKEESYGVLNNRNIRHEQLIQLAAGKMRQGERLIAADNQGDWHLEEENTSWSIYSKYKDGVYWVKNVIKAEDFHTNKLTGLITQLNNRKAIDSEIRQRKVLEKLSNDCSIVYERTSDEDILMLHLERKSNKNDYKMTEVSVYDRRCPTVPGMVRRQLELRYYQILANKFEKELCWVQGNEVDSSNVAVEKDKILTRNNRLVKKLNKILSK